MESRCVSINIGPPINDRVVCELSDSDHSFHPEDLKPRAGFTYIGTENHCSSSPCLNNGTCQAGFTSKGFRCICRTGFSGTNCHEAAKSCKELYDENNTFHYTSGYWSDKNEYNLPGGETGFDTQETKLPTYWNTAFSKICLGMKIGQQINFIVINKQADSLYSLIADGQYRATSLGLNTWKTLIGSQASLQTNCNKEGFNVVSTNSAYSRARIGVLGDNNECQTCDSRIGFGSGGNPDDSNKCGNVACCFTDNGNKNIKAMGYILVQ
ncbi:hypothetical protein ACROYT_G041133 [Oculina patagonica]